MLNKILKTGFLFVLVIYFSSFIYAGNIPGISIIPGSENSGSPKSNDGSYLDENVDISLKGRNLNLEVKRKYNSDYFNSSPKWSAINLEGIFYNDENYNLLYPSKFGHWLGRGWETNIGGYLYCAKLQKRKGYENWWAVLTEPLNLIN